MVRYARVLAALLFVASILVGLLVFLTPNRGLLDFGSFYMAGVVQEKGVDNPYGIYPQLADETGANFGYTDGRGHSPNLNPPISLYPFRVLADVNPDTARSILNYASALLFAGCAIAMLRAYPEHRDRLGVLWVAGFAGFWYTLALGQIYVLLFALGLGAWLLIEKGTHPIIAGVLIGVLIAIKPNFAVWPLFLLLAGHHRISITAFATAAAISAVPLVLEGPTIYQQWLQAAQDYPRLALAFNASLVGEAERIGVPALGYGLSAALVAAAAAAMWHLRPTALRSSAWGIVVGLLASPIAWVGYGMLMMPVLLSRRWRALEWVVAIGLAGVWLAAGLGEPFLIATLLLLFLLAREEYAHRRVTQTVETTLTPGTGHPQVAL
jgi:hypothetical protein